MGPGIPPPIAAVAGAARRGLARPGAAQRSVTRATRASRCYCVDVDEDSSWTGGTTRALAHNAPAATFRSHKVRIEIAEGTDAGRMVELAGPEVQIGTGRDCDLVLTDPTVSRRHVTLRIDRDGLRVIDAGSRNGTTVDGLRVLDAFARPDSLIVVGATTLRLRLLSGTIDLPLSTRTRFGGLLGASVAMRRVFALLERLAATDTTVLVEAETGAGKELVAEALHDEGQRSGGPFVVFDCSAVSANLMESELFGHMRGAFTGATGDRIGAFEAAHGGTIFLDEIGELPLDLQPKLLRVLESREVRRVGANTGREVDVRIIAATNRSLETEVDAGRFREDLFYRLAVVRVALPPLRERLEDIPLLVEHFAHEDARRGQPPVVLADATVRGLMTQAWPGNVRELRNAVQRTISLGVPWADAAPAADVPVAHGALSIDLDVPLKVARDRMIDVFEELYLAEALKRTGGNVSAAARVAGVDRKHLSALLRRHSLIGRR